MKISISELEEKWHEAFVDSTRTPYDAYAEGLLYLMKRFENGIFTTEQWEALLVVNRIVAENVLPRGESTGCMCFKMKGEPYCACKMNRCMKIGEKWYELKEIES